MRAPHILVSSVVLFAAVATSVAAERARAVVDTDDNAAGVSQCCFFSHCFKHKCCEGNDEPQSRSAPPQQNYRAANIPVGPIAESVPAIRYTPTLMMMPVLYGGPQAPATRDAHAERNCQASSDRIDELDDKVEALNLRMKTIMRAVELQTLILQELKEKGTIGNQQPGGEAPPQPAAAPNKLPGK